MKTGSYQNYGILVNELDEYEPLLLYFTLTNIFTVLHHSLLLTLTSSLYS